MTTDQENTDPKLAREAAAFRDALAKNPRDLPTLNRLGAVELARGRFAEAEQLFRAALALSARPADTLRTWGDAFGNGQQWEQALKCFDGALALEPGDVRSHNHRAVALLGLGRMAEAADALAAGLRIEPSNTDLLTRRGELLTLLGRSEDARAVFDMALRIAPNLADEIAVRAANCIKEDRFDEALALCGRALLLDPRCAKALNNRAVVLHHTNHDVEAEGSCLRAIEVDPTYADAWHNLGLARAGQEHYEAALAAFNEALRLRPTFTLSLVGRANVELDLGHNEEAARDFKILVRVAPDYDRAKSKLLNTRKHLCDWRERDALLADVIAGLRAGTQKVDPFESLSILEDPADQLLAAETYSNEFRPVFPAPLPARPPHISGRIRLGYLSGDLHLHATAYLAARMFELHDREQFEVTAFSTGPDTGDAMRGRLKGAFEDFVDVTHLSDAELAALIHEREIGILVDLKGFTLHNRTVALAHRPAPIQVSFLGYPGTLGADYIDYLIADSIVVPRGAEAFYKEKIVRLPVCYQPNSPRAADRRIPARAEYGLPERGIVFCCFNGPYKISPQIFAIWMRLLNACPGSVLWLFGSGTPANNLRREAERASVAPERLVFAGFLPQEQHLARIALADIVLDTAPYGAHTTASDALWAGVPVVTSPGATFASRVGASLVTAAGAPELSVPSLEAYEALALRLAREPELLAALKRKLRGARETAPLYDIAGFTRALERAYAAMAARWRKGEASSHIDIS